MSTENWISVDDELPKESGWYKIKTRFGDYEAPYVHNGKGELVWVLPDPSIVISWQLAAPNN